MPMMRLAVAGLSARMMAEAVVRSGGSAVAIDLFGDVDTRRAATQWHPIGRACDMQVDDDALLAALRAIAAQGVADAWIAGSGFESRPDLLAQGATVLPLIGTGPDVQRRLRDPAAFFATLASLGIAHPQTRIEAPARLDGWLAKDAGGSGGWQVHRAVDASSAPAATARHWQREVPGVPMSATFIANGQSACVLGFNRLLTRAVGHRPHVFRGVIGPVAIDDAVGRAVRADIDRLTDAFGLRGLCSIDFMHHAGQALVLEINARPPGSMCLYAARRPWLMRAHVRSSLRGRLPAAPRATKRVQGHEIVFARRTWTLDEVQAAGLATRGDCHDLPAAGTSFRRGDPVCSVSASAANAERVAARLAHAIECIAIELEPAA